MKKQISIEDAARATKVRAERITDLENDTYANFPNMTYAKGFLMIYAKYLGVDVADYAAGFGHAAPVGLDDYQYLNNTPGARPAVYRREPRPETKPVLIIGGVIAFLVVVGVGVMYLVVSLQRLELISPAEAKKALPEQTPLVIQRSPPVAPAPAEIADDKIVSAINPGVAAQAVMLPQRPPPSPAASPMTTPAPARPVIPPPPAEIQVRRAEPVLPLAPVVASPSPEAAASVAPSNEVVLKPIKKTWVTVWKDAESSPPIYEDWLYPNTQGLTFRGGKFWITVRDTGAVLIEKNGIPVPYETSVAIQ